MYTFESTHYKKFKCNKYFYRDGSSRSGLYCSLSYMIEKLKLEQEVDIFQTVKQIRTNRPQIIPDVVNNFYCMT